MTKHALRPMRIENRRPANPFTKDERHEGITAYLDERMPAKLPRDCEAVDFETHVSMDADLCYSFFGGEVLATWEWELLGGRDWFDSYDAYVEEHTNSRGEWEDAYDPWDGWAPDIDDAIDDSDHWLPYAKSMAEVRDIFGGSDFIIVHTFRA